MADIPHIHYNGASKVIIRLCEIANALIDGGGGDSASIVELQSQIAAIQETIGVSPGTITASVENDILILTGAGASVKGNHLLLISGDAIAADNVLHFGDDTVQGEVENGVLALDGASVSDNCAVIVSPGISVQNNVLYM